MATVSYLALGVNTPLATLVQIIVTVMVVFLSLMVIPQTFKKLFGYEKEQYMAHNTKDISIFMVVLYLVDFTIIGCAIATMVDWYGRNASPSYRDYLFFGYLAVLTVIQAWDTFLKICYSVWGNQYANPSIAPSDLKTDKVSKTGMEKALIATTFFHNLTLLFLIIWPSILLVTYENVFYNPARLQVPMISWIIVASAPILCVTLIFFWSTGRGFHIDIILPGSGKDVSQAGLAGAQIQISKNLQAQQLGKLKDMKGETVKIAGLPGVFRKEDESTMILKIAENLMAKPNSEFTFKNAVVRQMEDDSIGIIPRDVAGYLDHIYEKNGSELFKQNIGDVLHSEVTRVPFLGRYHGKNIVLFHDNVGGFGVGYGIWESLPEWFAGAYLLYMYAAFTQALRNEISGLQFTFVCVLMPVILAWAGHYGHLGELLRKFLLVGLLVIINTIHVSATTSDDYLMNPASFNNLERPWQSDYAYNMSSSFTVQMTTWSSFSWITLFFVATLAGCVSKAFRPIPIQAPATTLSA